MTLGARLGGDISPYFFLTKLERDSMSRLRCIIFILPLIGYPHFETTAQIDPKEGTSTVSGRVTLKGKPIRSVMVVLQSQMIGSSSDPGSTLRAKTDENGRFRITKVTAGRYYLSAIAPGFVAVGWMPFEPECKSLNIVDGENVENIDLELKRGGVITGRVTDSNGQPLVDEQVELLKLDKTGKPEFFYLQNLHEIDSTDDRGVYRIYGLPEGRYLVSVGSFQEEGSIAIQPNPTYYPRTFHPNVASESEAKIIEISEGTEVTGVDIAVAEARKAYDVFGRVVNAENGRPVAEAGISYSSVLPDGRTGRVVSKGERSDANGEFHLRGVLPGKFAILADDNRDSGFYSDPTICEINDDDLHGVEIKVWQGGSISGVAVIEGTNDPVILNKVSKIQASVFNGSGQMRVPGRRMTINPDGSFHAKGLQPGKNIIALGYNPEIQGLLVSRVERDGILQREGIEVGPGEQVSNVRVVFNYGNLAIHGKVKIIGGMLPKNVGLHVRASRMNMPAPNSSDVDARGQFTIENLVPGEYELSLFHYVSTPGEEQVDERLLKAISQVKQRVIVNTDSQLQITLVLDLSRREGNQ